MTPGDKQRAEEIYALATPGEWRYENLNWIGSPLFGVYASQGPGDRGKVLLDNVDTDANSYNNIEFIIAAHNFLPKMLQHAEALENNLASARRGAPQSDLPALSKQEIAQLKEVIAEASPGPWTWEPSAQKGQDYVVFGAGGKSLFPRMDTGENAAGNLTFITEAREIVPKVMERIEALETAVAHFNRPQPRPKPNTPTPKPPAPELRP